MIGLPVSSSRLYTKGVSKRYGQRDVVKKVNIEVNRGEVVGLLGPNGAGKTTTFYMMIGLIRPTGGSVFLDEKEITSTEMYKRARMGIGYLSQEPSVFRGLSVEENLRLVLQLSGKSKSEQEDALERLIDEFSLGKIRKNNADRISGGERRRTEIARSLVMEPDFILLDEPFVGIDPIAVEDIQGIINTLKSKGIGILITDHNVRETLSITDKAYLLYDGDVLRSGSAKELSDDDEVRRLYLGEKFRMDFEEDG
tara:strand:- start:1638 stop:2399 length:762 start_codon:yes stop_codon:yes gene_type:complete